MIRLCLRYGNLRPTRTCRRKTGEPAIPYPLAVAQICTEEIGLGPLAIVCALLHDTVKTPILRWMTSRIPLVKGRVHCGRADKISGCPERQFNPGGEFPENAADAL